MSSFRANTDMETAAINMLREHATSIRYKSTPVEGGGHMHTLTVRYPSPGEALDITQALSVFTANAHNAPPRIRNNSSDNTVSLEDTTHENMRGLVTTIALTLAENGVNFPGSSDLLARGK